MPYFVCNINNLVSTNKRVPAITITRPQRQSVACQDEAEEDLPPRQTGDCGQIVALAGSSSANTYMRNRGPYHQKD
jgi:hypothetical protein